MNKKGVILYRVSSDMQDFLLQKNKNREYCKANNIEIMGEYTEFDVSGYKTQLKDRVELLKILSRAEEDKDFDYFIVYNFDRIIRREDEAPFVLSHLTKCSITCIETMSGEHIKNEDMTDKLMNYIRFWQAEYESVKTSQRVTDAIKAKNENNEYAGGRPAYGYMLYDTGKITKKGKVKKDLKINESEAWIVRDIFDMYVNKGMGSLSIAEELNTNPIYKGKNRPFKRNGIEKIGRFRQSTIIRMIQNPTYTGRQRYNTVKTTRDGVETLSSDKWKFKDHRKELQIIDDEIFDKAQLIVKKNTIVPNETQTGTTKSGVLCSGLAYCECGAKLFSSFSRYNYIRKDGTVSDYGKIYRYCCREGREMNQMHKEKYGKTYYAAKKYDNLVKRTIIEYLESIDMNKLKENIDKYNSDGVVEIKNAIDSFKNENKQCYKNINNFEKRMDEDIENVDIYIKGIRRNEKRIEEVNKELDKLNKQLKQNQSDIYDYKAIYDNFKDYYNDFISENLEKQKLVLDQMIEKIIFKNNGIKIILKTVIKDSLINENTMYLQHNTSAYRVPNAQKHIISVICANFNDLKEISNG